MESRRRGELLKTMGDLNEVIKATKLSTPGGSVAVTGIVETAISVVDPAVSRVGSLFRVEAVCTVEATTPGKWALRSSAAGAVLQNLELGAAAVVGTRIVWDFPVPWNALDVNSVFTAKPSVATMGTWMFISNGCLAPL